MMIANANGFVVLLLFLILSACCIPGSAKPGEKNLSSKSSSESVSKMEKQIDKATKNIDKAMKNLDKALQKYFESGGAAFCIHGECEADEDDYVCSCEPGYTGQKCETDIDDCDTASCLNEGTCIDGVTNFTCDCADGYTGRQCETNIDDCDTASCLNEGTCIDGVTNFTCDCANGYTGRQCETNIDECASQPCIKSTICIDRVNGYDCACASGNAPVIQYDGVLSIESVAAPGKYLSFDPERGDDAVKFVDGVAKLRVIIPADPCNPPWNTVRFQMISDATHLDANVWVMQWNGTAGARFGLATGDNIKPDYYVFPSDSCYSGYKACYFPSKSQPLRYLTYQDNGAYWLEDNGNENTRLFTATPYESP